MKGNPAAGKNAHIDFKSLVKRLTKRIFSLIKSNDVNSEGGDKRCNVFTRCQCNLLRTKRF